MKSSQQRLADLKLELSQLNTSCETETANKMEQRREIELRSLEVGEKEEDETLDNMEMELTVLEQKLRRESEEVCGSFMLLFSQCSQCSYLQQSFTNYLTHPTNAAQAFKANCISQEDLRSNERAINTSVRIAELESKIRQIEHGIRGSSTVDVHYDELNRLQDRLEKAQERIKKVHKLLAFHTLFCC